MFKGIKFDIPYADFEAQLLKLGYKPDKARTRQQEAGNHCFTGTYEGESVWMTVYANSENNHVYMLSMQFRRENAKYSAESYLNAVRLLVSAQYNDPDVRSLEDGRVGDQNQHGDRWLFDDGDIMVTSVELVNSYVPAIYYVHQSMPQAK